MSQQAGPGVQVDNFDEVWVAAADDRWYHLRQVSLGRDGVPKLVVIYVACGAGLCWLVHKAGLGGLLLRWPSPLLAIATVLAVSAGLALMRPNGLCVHVFVPIALKGLFGPRRFHGWRPVAARSTSAWRPRSIAFSDDAAALRGLTARSCDDEPT